MSCNKVNTFAYYNKRVYRLDDSYDSYNKTTAIQKSTEYGDRIPIGVIYQEQKRTFHEKNIVLSGGKPLIDMRYNINFVQKIIEEFI